MRGMLWPFPRSSFADERDVKGFTAISFDGAAPSCRVLKGSTKGQSSFVPHAAQLYNTVLGLVTSLT